MTDDKTLQRLRDLELLVAVLRKDRDNDKEKLANLSGGINRGLWMIGGGLISIVVAWVMSGGSIGE
jgi:hypothetical protein